MNPHQSSHYTFGENELAAARLERLAAAYSASSSAFARHNLPVTKQRLLDLGSGLGLSTQMLHELAPSAKVTGYERSSSYAAMARIRFPHLTFREIDVLSPSFPDADLDVIYCRFLLTHLHRPSDVIAVSLKHLRPGGRLLVEEVSELNSSIPALATYYSMVREMQAHYGQELCVGQRLASIALSLGQARAVVNQTEIRLSTQRMAELHAMNIATWKSDPYMSSTHGASSLNALEARLATLAREPQDTSRVNCVMAQMVIERD